jgi:hypothetical protein
VVDDGPWLDHGSLWGGHGSHEQRRTCVSLEATRNLLIWQLWIVVEVAILPLCTWALMPGTLRMMWRRLLPPNMFKLGHTGRFELLRRHDDVYWFGQNVPTSSRCCCLCY